MALEIGSIKIDPEEPFTWASGYRMPIYNDNRLLLGNVEHRLLVGQGFQSILEKLKAAVDVVAGCATAGIAPATTLSNLLGTPLIYVRETAKKHGMKNQIEGLLKEGQKVVVVEDLISTGGSAVKTVTAIREAGGIVEHCVCIFNYGFPEALDLFKKARCQLHSLLTFAQLLEYAESKGALTQEQSQLLQPWSQSPFTWAEENGLA